MGKHFSHKNINAQVNVLHGTILNIFRNCVPNKFITCGDKEPVWMNENIKSRIKLKNLFYKQYAQNDRKESEHTELNELILPPMHCTMRTLE